MRDQALIRSELSAIEVRMAQQETALSTNGTAGK
jgi:hypothetical protein